MLEQLEIIHIYNYSAPKGQQSPLDKFIRTTNPIKLSTCMRQLFLFDSEQITSTESIEKLIYQINNPSLHQAQPVFNYLKGKEAYTFLLYWSIGALHTKKPFDDDRLLGELRNNINGYSQSKSDLPKNAYNLNKAVLNSLLCDAKNMHKVLLKYKYKSYEKKQALFGSACKNCAEARENGYLDYIKNFDYACFFDKENMWKEIQLNLTLQKQKLDQALEKAKTQKAAEARFFSSTPLIEKHQTIVSLKSKLSNSGLEFVRDDLTTESSDFKISVVKT